MDISSSWLEALTTLLLAGGLATTNKNKKLERWWYVLEAQGMKWLVLHHSIYSWASTNLYSGIAVTSQKSISESTFFSMRRKQNPTHRWRLGSAWNRFQAYCHSTVDPLLEKPLQQRQFQLAWLGSRHAHILPRLGTEKVQYDTVCICLVLIVACTPCSLLYMTWHFMGSTLFH